MNESDFTIIHHRLYRRDGTGCPFQLSPNIGGQIDHRFLVLHYTAGRSAASAVAWLVNPEAQVSAHLVIGRDGDITQLVPFDRVAWHAGQSRWAGFTGLNAYSIGIELDNAGRLQREGDRWQSWFGEFYQAADVVEAVHQHEHEATGWHQYPSVQIETALALSRLLVREYDLREVLGHDDIAPGRKCDPGPAFPMERFREAVMVDRSNPNLQIEKDKT